MLSRSVQRVTTPWICRRGYAAPGGSGSTQRQATDAGASAFKKKAKREKIRPKPKRTWDPARKGTFTPLPANQLKGSPLFTGNVTPPEPYPLFTPNEVKATTEPWPATFTDKNKVDPLAKYGVPRNLLIDSRFFPQPVSLIREFTKTVVDKLDSARTMSSYNTRVVLHGRAGTGKSYSLLQAAHYCNRKGWIVIYIPRAIKLVDSSTTYEYDARTQTYVQHDFARQILARLLEVEGKRLEEIPVSDNTTNAHSWLSLKPGHTLASLIPGALSERSPAMEYLNIVMTSLSEQKDYPVLLAIDDFQALYQTSHYRNPHYYLIESYHLSIPRLLLEYASGKRTFQQGAVLGAVSCTDKRFDVPLEVRKAINMAPEQPTDAWSKRVPEYDMYAKGLKGLKVPDRLSLSEASALFELWKQTGVIAADANDELFLAKYSESSGNPREFIWKGLLGSITV